VESICHIDAANIIEMTAEYLEYYRNFVDKNSSRL
jgi:hypothetical protein